MGMVLDAVDKHRRKVRRAQVRLLTLVLAGIAVMFLVSRIYPLTSSGWVTSSLALLCAAVAWVTFGTRTGGWLQASIVTWVAQLASMTAVFMFNGLGVASLLAGFMFGTVWAMGLLLPVAGVSILVRDPAR